MSGTIIILSIVLVSVALVIVVFALNFRLRKHADSSDLFKSVSMQLLAVTVWISILTNIFLPKHYFVESRGASLLVFAVSIIVGILLIRSIFREIDTEKNVEHLIEKLHKNNINLKKLDEIKSEFVSLASHQLRGPLANIQGYSSMLLEKEYGEIPEHIQEPVNRIFQSSAFLGFLINDFLDIARIEKGEMEYKIQDFDLTKILNSLYKEFQIAADSAGLTLKKDFDDKKTMTVIGDMSKVKQIFSNLIDNAIKYTRKGEITISCQQKGSVVRVRIKDTGIGMDEETKQKLFQKFSRGTSAIRVNAIGSGLGLFIAATMTKAQKGKMWAESEGIDKGSAFYVELPSKK